MPQNRCRERTQCAGDGGRRHPAGIEPAIKVLDADAKTAAAAAHQLGCEVGAIADSPVFDCDGGPLLVMASGGDI